MIMFGQADVLRPAGGASAAMLVLLASLIGMQPAGAAPALSRQATGLAVLKDRAPLLAAGRVNFEIEDIETESGQEVSIFLALPTSAELERADSSEGAFLLIRNIPAGISFSAGMPTGRVWIVPLREAARLRLVSTPETAGDFRLEFHIIGSGNRVLAEKTISVALRPRRLIGTVGTVRRNPPSDVGDQPAPPEAERLAAGEEAILLKRGQEVLRQGGIAAARLIFQELAKSGSSQGAFALARSYDPAYVAIGSGTSVAPNIEIAVQWYRRAAELGSIEATKRLAEIAPRP